MYIPEDDKRPLFTLTIREFTGILKGIIKEEVEVFSNKTQNGKIDQTEEQDIVGIDKACVIAGIVKSTMYTKVSLKHVPCLTRGKPLRFSKKHLEMGLDLEAHLILHLKKYQKRKPKRIIIYQMRRNHFLKKKVMKNIFEFVFLKKLWAGTDEVFLCISHPMRIRHA